MGSPGFMFGASLALAIIMCFAYAKQKRLVLFPSGAAYAVTAASTTLLSWPAISPAGATAVIAITIVLPALALCLFLIDYLWAPFRLEMRYLVILWWLLAPLAVPLNLLGLLL